MISRAFFIVLILVTLHLIDAQNNSTRRTRRLRGRNKSSTTTTEGPMSDSESDLFDLNDLAAKISNGKNPEICTPERLVELEKCTQEAAFIGVPNFIPPSNRKELRKFCRVRQQSVDCALQYAKDCMKPFPAQLVGMIATTMGRVLRNKCRSRTEARGKISSAS